jgi:copper chaperone CopZ
MRMLSVIGIAIVLAAWASTPAVGIQNQEKQKPATQTCTLKVSGMTCAGCEAAVRMAARTVEGVSEVKASYAKGNAEVTFDPGKTTPDEIAKVISEKSGFKAEPMPAPKKSS